MPEGYNKYTGKWEDSSIRESPSRHPASGNHSNPNTARFNGSEYRANGVLNELG